MMTRQLTTAAPLFAAMLAACGAESPPLPADVYEEGWDDTTRSQRIQLLRRDLDGQIEALRASEPGSKIHRTMIEDASRTLSTLRPELTTTEHGRDEYRELETLLESLTGDAE